MSSGHSFLLLISLFLAAVAEVKWRNTANVMNGSHGCDFQGNASWSSSQWTWPFKITSRACLNMCYHDARCTQSTWTPDGECHLKKFDSADVELKCASEQYVCGIKRPAEANKTEYSECTTAVMKKQIYWESIDFDMYWNHGCDFVGHDISPGSNLQITSEECKHECYRRSSCTHFTWTPGDHFCYLKSITSSNVQLMCAPEEFICGIKGTVEAKKPVYSECNTTAVTQINKTIGDYDLDMYSGCDFPGNNIKWHAINRKETLADCDRKCTDLEWCTHITYTPYGDCIMKMNATVDIQPTCRPAGYFCGINARNEYYRRVHPKRDLECSKTAVISKMTWKRQNYGMHWLDGCDFPGHNFMTLYSYIVNSAQECMNACYQNTECTHFIWTGIGPGGCLWKTITTEEIIRPKCAATNYVCGYKGFSTHPFPPLNCS